MQSAPIPGDETLRLNSLQVLRILDTAPETRFDRITHIARRMFRVPISLISLVDKDRQWFKSCQGLAVTETPRAISFCGHAILDEKVFVVEDTHLDNRFADNPLVVDPPRIRFYAGAPIHAPSGQRIGTLCLIDQEPRTFSDEDRRDLDELRRLVDEELLVFSQATMDELTRISNRRGFFGLAESILPTAERNSEPLTLAYIDLDGFKAINDEYGHDMGDHVLTIFAGLLMKSFVQAEVVARLGGDEFCILWSGMEPAEAQVQLRDFVARFQKSALYGQYPFLNWSVGLACSTGLKEVTIDGLVSAADKDLYRHKQR